MLLTDIYGTLLEIPGEEHLHLDALKHGIQEVTGLTSAPKAGRSGHTDFTLVKDAMSSVGLESMLTQQVYELIEKAAGRYYADHAPENLDRFLLRGITATLGTLRADSRVRVVPMSGYCRPIAEYIITECQIEHLIEFGFGSFGGYDVTRDQLASNARKRAGGNEASTWPPDRIVVVENDLLNIRATCLRLPTQAVCIGVGPRISATRHKIHSFNDLPDYLNKQIFPDGMKSN